MANIVPNSFKQELLSGTHDFTPSTGNTFHVALYSTVSGFSAATTAYTTTNEASGTNYTAGGTALTNTTLTLSGTVAVASFSDITFSSVTLTASAALIFNTTEASKAVVVLDFGGDKTATNGDFTIEFPTADSSNAIIRIA